ncbi:putative DCD domain-containing protein NRP [Dioscorea sansibarensis]
MHYCVFLKEFYDAHHVASFVFQRFAPTAAAFQGAMYVVGGFNGKDYLRSFERCDPREAYWKRLPSMNVTRGCHSMVVFNDALYVMGGYDGEGMVSSVEVFDPRMECWAMAEPMNFSRGYGATVVLDDHLLTMGGVEDQETIVESVEYYSEGSGWAVNHLKAVGKRCFFSAIVLFVIGIRLNVWEELIKSCLVVWEENQFTIF